MAERKFHKLIEHIKQEIKLGNLKNGSQIFPERTLAENLNIGRSSVREGIKILEIIGLIESKRGGGNYITNDFKNTTFHRVVARAFISTMTNHCSTYN